MKNLIYIASVSWSMIDLKSKMTFYLSVILFIFTTCLRVSGPVFFAYLLQNLNGDGSFLIFLAAIYALIFCASRLLEEFRLACYIYFEQILQKSLVLNTLKKYFIMSFSAIRNHSSSETSIIIDRGLGGIRAALYNAIFTLLPLIVECILLLVVIGIKTTPFISAQLLLLIVSFIAATFYFSSRTQKLQQKWFATASKNYQIMSEGIKTFEFLRSFHQTSWLRKRYAIATDKFILEVRQSLKPGVFLGIIQGILLFLVFFISNLGVLNITDSITERTSLLVIVNGLLLQMSVPLVQFSASYRFFVQGLSSAKQLFDMTSAPVTTETIPHVKGSSPESIVTRDITIQFSGGQSLAFADVRIQAEKITVFVGPSGVGKSSLAKVIAGIVEYDGSVESAFSVNDIYYLHQHVDIFDLSLRDNIILGLEYDPKRLQHILYECGFSDKDITDFSDRPLGEGGKNISGGQAQRIGLARMLYHDAKVMILDEPTSGLDDETAHKVISAIKTVAHGRTCVIVTHDQRVKDIGDLMVDIEKAATMMKNNSVRSEGVPHVTYSGSAQESL